MTLRKDNLTLAAINDLQTHEYLEQILLSAEDATGIRANNVRIDESICERTLFIASHIEKLECIDSELHGCDLSTAFCNESSHTRVRFIGCRMTGVDMSRSTFKDVVFEDCKLDMANFRQAKLQNVQFVDCLMDESDFQGAELANVLFKSCQLERIEFNNSVLEDVDLRSSQLFDIRGWSSMKGAILEHTQLLAIAPELAVQLGIRVEG